MVPPLKILHQPDSFVDAYNNLAAMCISLGKKKEAIVLYKQVLTFGPDYSLAHNNLAVVYFKEKQYAFAIKHYNRALKLGYNVEPKFRELINSLKHRD